MAQVPTDDDIVPFERQAIEIIDKYDTVHVILISRIFTFYISKRQADYLYIYTLLVYSDAKEYRSYEFKTQEDVNRVYYKLKSLLNITTV